MYTTITARVIDQTLQITNIPKLASGGENDVRVEVSFDSLWSGFGKTAIFYRKENQVYHVVMVSDTCLIPREVLTEPGKLYFGILGTSGATVRTTEVVTFNVVQGAITAGVSQPLPDVYKQVLSAQGKNAQDIAVERARLDNLVASGTVGDAELLDVRVGADGTTYASAGAAVRAQIGAVVNAVEAVEGGSIFTGENSRSMGFTWENKRLTEGVPVSSSNRVLTSGVTHVPAGFTVRLLNPDYQYTLHYHDSEGVWSHGGGSWLSVDTVLHEDAYIRIQVRRADDANFSASTFNHSAVLGFYTRLTVTASNLTPDLQAEVHKLQKDRLAFTRGGYIIDTGLVNVYDRAYCLIPEYKVGGRIIFDNTKYALNYFIVNSNNLSETYYTPNVWDVSGEIVTTTADVYPSMSILILVKVMDGSSEVTSEHLEALPLGVEYQENLMREVDVFLFAGQSNMAGRGATSISFPESAPYVAPGIAWEYRAVSDPTCLHAVAEPFGVNEDKVGGINDEGKKTGSMVSAFVNSYYARNGHVPVVGVSAAKGGSSLAQWQPSGVYLSDAVQRFTDCISYLKSNGFTIRHKYALWCQGETDGDSGTTREDYASGFDNLITELSAIGIEKLFMVRIGNCNVSGDPSRYTDMIRWQTEIAQEHVGVVMASTAFAGMKDRGLMKDDFHYYQAGYNEVGAYAGVNAGLYAMTGKEPTMFDPESGALYYSHKN